MLSCKPALLASTGQLGAAVDAVLAVDAVVEVAVVVVVVAVVAEVNVKDTSST